MEDPYAPPSGDHPRPGHAGGGRRAPAERPPQRSSRPPRPPRPPMDPAELKVVNRRVATFVLLVLAALVAATFPLPWQLGGLGFALAAVGAGIWALRSARGPGLRQQVAPLVVVGLAFTVFMALSMGASLLLWSAQAERQECLARALTLQAQDACERRYEEAVEERLAELSGR